MTSLEVGVGSSALHMWGFEPTERDLCAFYNRQRQADFFVQLRSKTESTGPSLDVVAERLGISEDEVVEALSGSVNLTLKEIRLLAIATEVVVTFRVNSDDEVVRAARDVFQRMEHQGFVSNWQTADDDSTAIERAAGEVVAAELRGDR